MLGIKGWIGGAMVLVGLIALAIIARNWSCRKQAGPRVRTYSYAVASVPNGATIAIKTGLRQRRTGQVHIAGIAAPADGRFAEPSRANLQQLAGGRIRVEITRHGLFGDAETDEVSADEVLDARGELVGTVYGESGAGPGHRTTPGRLRNRLARRGEGPAAGGERGKGGETRHLGKIEIQKGTLS